MAPKQAPTFTVVIPTLNRADVLYSAIETCVRQDEAALEILVSDNGSDDDTRNIVQCFTDSRIRYVNPGRQLGMPEHWDFALSHVAAGFVTVLGDDDALLPGAIRQARQLLATNSVQALAWRKAEYHWPDHILPSYRNWLQLPLCDGTEIVESAAMLRDVLAFRRTYTDLPCIYNSFVATEVLDAVRSRSADRLFPCITPDLYSGLAIACVVDRYAFSSMPLSINAASRHSNGTSATHLGAEIESTRRHFTGSATPLHPSFVRCASVPVLIAEAAFTAQTHLTPSSGWPELDWTAMFELAARYAEYRSPVVMAETLKALDEIARRNGQTATWEPIRSTVEARDIPALPAHGISANGESFVFDGAVLGLRTAADASVFAKTALDVSGMRSQGKRITIWDVSALLPRCLDARLREIWKSQLLRLSDLQKLETTKPPWYLTIYPRMRGTWDGLRSRIEVWSRMRGVWDSSRSRIDLWSPIRRAWYRLRSYLRLRSRIRRIWCRLWARSG